MMGTKGALEAMQTNEKMTVARYEEALQKNLSSKVRDLLARNFQDERRHLVLSKLYYLVSVIK